MKSNKEIQRGEWDELARDDKNLCILKKKYKKSVILLFSCVGSEVDSQKMKNKKISIPQPTIVQSYNEWMGDRDFCYRNLAYYNCRDKSKNGHACI